MANFLPNQLNVTVSSAGSRVQLTSTVGTFVRLAFIQANSGNTGIIYIGNKLVSSSVYGLALPAGASIAFGGSTNDPTFDMSNIYADTSHNGDGFSVLYY